MRAAKTRRRTLGFEACEPRSMLAAVAVTSSLDSGPGSFRAAIERANADATVSAINFEARINSISLEDTITYTGTQALRIDGRIANIQPVEAKNGDFDLFVASGGADLSLSQLTFRRGAQGVVVAVPLLATGTVDVRLDRVTVSGNDLFGLHIIDQTEVPPPPEDPDAEPTEIGSDAGVSLTLLGSGILENGTAAHDQDGIRVDERGLGSIHVQILNSKLNGNGAEGIEMDEGGDGGVELHVIGSSFNNNGFISSGDPEDPDFDDGIDIDEKDDGSVRATIINSSASGNFDEGIDLNEDGLGDLVLLLVNSRVNNNTDEGVALAEVGAGNLIANLINVQASGNGADGVRLEEFDGGDLSAHIVASAMNENGGFGIFASQAQPGSGSVRLVGVSLRRNAEGPFNTTVENEDSGEIEDSGVVVSRI